MMINCEVIETLRDKATGEINYPRGGVVKTRRSASEARAHVMEVDGRGVSSAPPVDCDAACRQMVVHFRNIHAKAPWLWVTKSIDTEVLSLYLVRLDGATVVLHVHEIGL